MDAALHSVAGPSKLHQIVQCPASIVLQRGLPEDVSPERVKAAADGIAAHWAMAELMAGRQVREDQVAANGVALDEDMIEAAELIVEDVRQTLAPYGMDFAQCATEVPVTISAIHPLCWGTPDIRVWLPTKPLPTLVVWDLKYGFRFVSEFENYQLAAYARGCMDQAGLPDTSCKLDLRIVQPRAYGRGGAVRSWAGYGHMVRAVVNEASNAVHAALSEPPAQPPQARVGPECGDCLARLKCDAFAKASGFAMQYAGTHIPHDMTSSETGVELRFATQMLTLLKARVEALDEDAARRVQAGERVPHWKAGRTPGRTIWIQPDSAVISMGRALQLDLAKPPKAVTPKQAIDLGLPKSLVDACSKPTGGSFKLVPDDGTEARRIFG